MTQGAIAEPLRAESWVAVLWARLTSRTWWWWYALTVVFWIGLWFSINTGPGTLTSNPSGLIGWGHFLRTLFPLSVAGVCGVAVLVYRLERIPGPVALWLAYGVIALAACAGSPAPWQAAYWGLCYLAAIFVLVLHINDQAPLDRAWELNVTSWATATLFLLIMFALAGGAILQGYGVVNRAGSVAGMPMSRASGLARFASIPGIVAFCCLWFTVGFRRIVAAAVFVATAALIYVLQSRGAIVSFAGAVLLITLFTGRQSRLIAVFLVAGVLLLELSGIVSETFFLQTWEHLTRGSSVEKMSQLTGRVEDWEMAWPYILRSPLWGWGLQADRYLMNVHIHNTYMYALASGGFLGLVCFVAGLIWSWVAALQVLGRQYLLNQSQRLVVLQAVGMLAFFTLRGIPEVSGALFNVDLMILFPAVLYLSLMHRSLLQDKTLDCSPAKNEGVS